MEHYGTLSEPTGGRAIFTDDIEKVRDAFRELVQELSTQYLLSYVPPTQLRTELGGGSKSR